MITNHLLEDKYRVQKELAEEAGYDVRRYHANLRAEIKAFQQRRGIVLKYADESTSSVHEESFE